MELTGFQPYQINKLEGFTSAISHLVCMMMHARQVTLGSVKNLSVEELDYLMDEKSNTIGALLAHIAATEKGYQVFSFEKREMEGQELSEISAAQKLGDQGRAEIRGNDLAYYVEELRVVRDNTLLELKKRNDEWLMDEMIYTKNQMANNLYMWYHVFEDETNHRGQINLIKKNFRK